MQTSPVKDIRGYCFYTGLFDPSFPCPCRAKLAGQRCLWWSDMAFLPVRSLGPVYLQVCLKEPRGCTKTLHMLRIMSPSYLIKVKLSCGKTQHLSLPASVNQKQFKGLDTCWDKNKKNKCNFKFFIYLLVIVYTAKHIHRVYYYWLRENKKQDEKSDTVTIITAQRNRQKNKES